MTIDVLEWCFRVFSALNVINHKFFCIICVCYLNIRTLLILEKQFIVLRLCDCCHVEQQLFLSDCNVNSCSVVLHEHFQW